MTARPVPAPGHHELIALDSVDSTNREARSRAEAGAPDGTLVWAREQTAGRGRHGRSWASPRGNLYLSGLFRPACTPAEAPQLGFVAGVAMAEAIFAACGASVQLKWPNDLLLGDRKIAGILLESADDGAGALAWVIVGIGVNIAPHPAGVERAGDLRTAGHEVSVEALLDAFVPRLMAGVARWRADGFAPVREGWMHHALPAGTPVSVRLPDGAVTGRFAGIDAAGNLCLADEAGERRIAVGDVFPLSNAGTGGA